MLVLVFDTETTGLPASKILNPDTLHLWPYIVQFSYIIYDTDKKDIVLCSDKIVKLTNDIIIPDESINIHGITNEMSQKDGTNINVILSEFFHHLRNIDLLVGHNVSFDINMVKVELLRIIYDNSSLNEVKTYKFDLHFFTNYINIYCTLQESIDLCNIKGVTKFGKEYTKYPKLLELHQKLFESVPNNLHNSFNDILVTLRCFMKLKYDVDLNKTCGTFIKKAKTLKIF
jgi:DNA polymerase III epsilon subunit-like protein